MVTSARGAGKRPRIMRAVKVVVLLATLQGILAVGLLWLNEEWLSPKTAPRVERIAELYAAAAGRFVMTADQPALAHLVKQAATWPEIVYLGVEDANGTVLAHTDPGRIGRVWREVMSTWIRSTAGAAHREVTVLLVNPDHRAGPPVGRIRLGYITIDEGTAGAPVTGSRISAVPFLVGAMVAALPLGGLVLVLTKPPVRPPGETPGLPLENLAQVAWAHHGRLVTEVGRLRGALGAREAEVAQLAKAVEQAPQSKPVDLSAQRAILSITHTVRSSLSNILGFSKLLLRELDGTLTETQTADVRNIQRAGAELLTFVTALSELSRAEAGQVLLQSEAVDAAAVLHELAVECGTTHALDLKVECPAELPTVRTDRAHLGQILRTLILQATTLSGHGEVVLRPWANGQSVHISVAHPGRVISDQDMVTLFDPFSSKETGGGRVGLSLARSLAVLNGGGIAVESQAGNGVVFTLTVPIEITHARLTGGGSRTGE